MTLFATRVAVCALVSAGCASPGAVDRPTAPGTTDPAAPTTPRTRYRVGDFIVYRYGGAFTPVPIELREEVRAQEGERLRIDVTLRMGDESSRWVQVLTDTPANQQSNVIDGLYELVDDKAVKLDNPDNRDAFRLYQRTLIMPEGRATDVAEASCTRTIGDASYACTCTTGKNTWQGRAIQFELARCDEFLWTHGPSRFWDAATGEDVHRTEVVAVGRDASAAPAPLEP